VGVKATIEHPLIAVLTQPVVEEKRKAGFDFDEYILDVNNRFVSLSGARPVYLSYYLAETEEGIKRLYEILDQVNGVLFTGGNLTLVDKQTGEKHPYYKTSKLILEYCMRLKDTKGVELPILAIC
jgi:hypothetical protein